MSMLQNTVNSIFREHAAEYLKQYNPDNYTTKIIRAIVNCRTEALGGHIETCDTCGHEITLYNSCRDRHCPQCQFMKKAQWIENRKDEVLPFQYFHVVFTLPDSLNPIVYRNKEIIYKLLFDKTKETLLSISEDEKYFGAGVGFFSILHTWGQKLNLHPHIHCVVPGGGYIPAKKKWISAPHNYFLPVDVLKLRFRSIFLVSLKELFKSGKLYLQKTKYQEQRVFYRLIDDLFKTEWVVYIKESFKSSDSVIEYLAKYTHRIAISNHRILSVDQGIVTFRYRDYREENKQKTLSLPVMNFMRRFLLHIVPYRFVRIRYYGFLSNSTKKKLATNCREYYGVKEKKRRIKKWFERLESLIGLDIHQCQKCLKGTMERTKIIDPFKNRGP